MFLLNYRKNERLKIDASIEELRLSLIEIESTYVERHRKLSEEYTSAQYNINKKLRDLITACNEDTRKLEHEFHNKREGYNSILAKLEAKIEYLDTTIRDKTELISELDNIINLNKNSVV